MKNISKKFFKPIVYLADMRSLNKFSCWSLIILLLLKLVNSILSIPINDRVMVGTISSMHIPEEQVDAMSQIAHKMRYLQIIGSELSFVLVLLFNSFLIFIITKLLKNRIEYKKSLQLLVYSYYILAIGDLVNTFYLYFNGLNNINNVGDVLLRGANMFVSVESVGITLYTLLSYVNPFQILFCIFLYIGVKVLSGMQGIKSFIVILIFWLITIIVPTLSVFMSEMSHS